MKDKRGYMVNVCRLVGKQELSNLIETLPDEELGLAVPYVQYAIGESMENIAEAMKKLGIEKEAAACLFEAAQAKAAVR